MKKMNSKSWNYLLLTLLCALLYLPGINSLPLIDRDSPHFAQATKQMIETGDYFSINFQDKPRHLKPPGIYWLQALSVNLSGNPDSPWPYRIPGILGALLAVLLTYYFGRQFFSDAVAFAAAFILAICLLMQIETRLVVTDTVLLATIVAMQGAFACLFLNKEKEKQDRYVMIFWLAMAMGILIKGLTPLIAGLTGIALYFFSKTDRSFLRRLKIPLGILFLMIFTLAWLLPFSYFGKSNFLWDMIHGDLLPKIQGGQQSHGMPPGFFLLTFTLMFWPGSLFVARAALFGYQHFFERIHLFLIAWILPNWIFFEIIPTKLPEYILPIYPAVALLSAQTFFIPWRQIVKNKWQLFFDRLQISYWFLNTLIICLCIAAISYLLTKQINYVSIAIAITVFIASIFTIRFALSNQPKKYLFTMGMMVIITIFWLFQIVLPQQKALWLSNTVATYLKKNNLNTQTLYAIGYEEPSLVFAVGTKKIFFRNLQENPWAQISDQKFLGLVDSKMIKSFKDSIEKTHANSELLACFKGFNYSHGKWTILCLYQINK